jgi:hypothetical protein
MELCGIAGHSPKINAVLLHVVIDDGLNMVCNGAMSKHPDAKLIEAQGGPAKLAEVLGLQKYGGVQRVQNWTVRGIPAQVKLNHPEIFLPNWTQAPANQAQAATETIAVTGS